MPRPVLTHENTLQLNCAIWRLADARLAATQILTDPTLLRPMLKALFGRDRILRHHAADTARRVTEKQPELLTPFAERLLGFFCEIGPSDSGENWRTRAHLAGVYCECGSRSWIPSVKYLHSM